MRRPRRSIDELRREAHVLLDEDWCRSANSLVSLLEAGRNDALAAIRAALAERERSRLPVYRGRPGRPKKRYSFARGGS
jgi:hypothetical protein